MFSCKDSHTVAPPHPVENSALILRLKSRPVHHKIRLWMLLSLQIDGIYKCRNIFRVKYSFDACSNQMNLAGADRMAGSQTAQWGTAGNHSPIKPTKSKSSFTSASCPEAALACELSRLKAARVREVEIKAKGKHIYCLAPEASYRWNVTIAFRFLHKIMFLHSGCTAYKQGTYEFGSFQTTFTLEMRFVYILRLFTLC